MASEGAARPADGHGAAQEREEWSAGAGGGPGWGPSLPSTRTVFSCRRSSASRKRPAHRRSLEGTSLSLEKTLPSRSQEPRQAHA